MAENDEPLDDLRAVGMTAGAAAARVAETIIRDQQNRRQDESRRVRPIPDAGSAPTLRARTVELGGAEGVQQPDELDQAEAWATPERLGEYELDRDYSDSAEGRDSAARRLVGEWKRATSYDGQRGDRDAAMQAAGVPDEVRHAKTTADLMNGTDPAEAAQSGSKTKARPARAPKTVSRERGR